MMITQQTHPTAKAAWRRRRAALARGVLAPPPKLTLSEWADRYRMLSGENSAEPGRWRTSRAPYLRGIMDACTDPLIEEVCVMKSAQIGYTDGVVNNVVGFYIDQDPAPILVVQISDGEAQKWSKEKLAPMLRDTPRLRGKVAAPRSRVSDNTILAKAFPGGHLGIVGANAPSGLRARPRRVVIFDEIDGYPASAGSEGDPISLGRKRTSTFWNRKIVMGSTPTIKDASRIEQAFDRSDQRRYHLPCPHCQHLQHLKWKQLQWDKETAADGTITHLPDTAHYVCEECGACIDESEKQRMLEAGVWIAGKPGRRIAGFHINALYSPWARWAELVRDFLAAKDIPEHFQTFVNTVLGETYEDRGERVDANSLTSRCETYNAEVPKPVGILTAAADVQGDRIEFKVKGWGVGQESWLIDHQVFWGDPGQSDVWEALDIALRKQYSHESGAKIGIRAGVIDSGGHHADAVSAFVKPRQKRKVFAIKGHSEGGRPIWPVRPTKPGKRGVKIFMIGTDTAKDVIFSRLRRSAEGPTRMHFPIGTPDEYFAQLTGEKKIRQLIKGRPVFRYMKTRPRNEALDLEVYNLAALHSLGRAVYENLDRWVKKIQEIGADLVARGVVVVQKPVSMEPDGADETGKGGESAALASLQRQRSQRPRRGGWVNRWR